MLNGLTDNSYLLRNDNKINIGASSLLRKHLCTKLGDAKKLISSPTETLVTQATDIGYKNDRRKHKRHRVLSISSDQSLGFKCRKRNIFLYPTSERLLTNFNFSTVLLVFGNSDSSVCFCKETKQIVNNLSFPVKWSRSMQALAQPLRIFKFRSTCASDMLALVHLCLTFVLVLVPT